MNTPIEKIEFVQYHKPPLPSGDYTIRVKNRIRTEKQIDKTFATTQKFSVRGNRFTFSPADIHAVYPPPDSFSDYHLVLPHIILNRSTLPWEREPKPQASSNSASWLALLLFNENEEPTLETFTLKQLEASEGNKTWSTILGGIDVENENEFEDELKLNVIKIKKSLLKAILPKHRDLEFLSHIRLSKTENGAIVGGEKSTIFCNRLPKPAAPGMGAKTTVHLVSIEDRYSDDLFDFGTAGEDDSISLVSLYNWTFTCSESKEGFREILENLNVGTMRLPDNKNRAAKKFIEHGFVPLRHAMRMGQQTVSWYHSPLAPGMQEIPAPSLPAGSADELLHYDSTYGLFDVTYAAAWELGRKMAFEDPKFAMELFHWKKEQHLKVLKSNQLKKLHYLVDHAVPAVSDLQKAEEILLHWNLSPNPDGRDLDIPAGIESFFHRLKRLEGIPFDYLVPHDELLPPESIRFFRVDPLWVNCLVDGAYSLGEDAKSGSVTAPDHPEITGFLLRSKVLPGWPGMLIKAYDHRLIDADGKLLDEDATKYLDAAETTERALRPILKKIRSSYLSEDVLLVLFEGQIQTVDFSLAPDTLHFGLDEDGDSDVDNGDDSNHDITGKFWQVLRNEIGEEQNGVDSMTIKNVPFRNEGEKLVIDIAALAGKMSTALEDADFCSADFALQMMEGAAKVRILSQLKNPQ